MGEVVGHGIGDGVELAARVTRLLVSLCQHLALRLTEVEHFGTVSVAMIVSRARALLDVAPPRRVVAADEPGAALGRLAVSER
ncbi:MAG: hypothetical protein WCB10_11185 [Steroidobacteraceae bacterium]